MRREIAFRLWTCAVGLASLGSGALLWHIGECVAGGLGIATALLHLAWALKPFASGRRWGGCVLCTLHKTDLLTRLRGRWRRRPIVIPRLRSDTRTVRHG